MKEIEWVENKKINNSEEEILGFDKKSIKSVLQFHQTLPNYQKTPLIDLKELAKYCGVKKIKLNFEYRYFRTSIFCINFSRNKEKNRKCNFYYSY